MATAVFELGAALMGACVGSFLNVVIWRLPQEDPRARSLGGRSHCPRCGALIRWFDNVPVLGWLMLRGRARCCGGAISPRYPLVELLTAVMFFLLAAWPPGGPIFVPSGDGMVVDAARAAHFGFCAVFVALLIALTFIDFDVQLLPDALTKPGMAIGVVGGLWPGIAGEISHDDSVALPLRTLLASIVGLLVGGGTTWAVRAVGSHVFKKEAMGFGDVKLLAMIGAFLGWRAALLSLFVGCLFGAVVGGALALRKGLGLRIPFGPYLAAGALVALFAEHDLVTLLFERWPEWQRQNPSSQWLLVVMAIGSLGLLFALIRRGRRSG